MNATLKIGLVTDSDAFAGTERHILDLARGLREKNITVSIICPACSPLASQGRNEQMNVVPMEKHPGVDTDSILLLRSLFNNGSVDILHVHNGRTAFLATLAKTISLHGCVIGTQHFLHPAHEQRTGFRGAAARAAHQYVNRSLDHIIAISNAVRTHALTRSRIQPEKLTVIPNGISDPNLRILQPRNAIRNRLGIGNTPLVVCIARLEIEKDIATLIRAFHCLPDPRPYCVIAGEGSQRNHLEVEIRCRKLGDRIKLIGFQNDSLSLVNAADILVLPSIAEPFGLAILEAMALRKPTIATLAGGPLEIIENGVTGLLIPPGDEIQMARALYLLVNNPELRLIFGNNGRAKFLAQFTAERMTNSICAIYSKVCSKPLHL